MMDIKDSTLNYDDWLVAQLGDEVVHADLVKKHEKMRDGAFSFLRATYWRWSETIRSVCGALFDAPSILAIGDTHLENFGTWRDIDGRLVWGANDFDDAAVMPYPLDLVRLAASAVLARKETSAANACASIWKGYVEGLEAPMPVVLERDHGWLREAILLPEKARAKWWSKFDHSGEQVPERYEQALVAALPDKAAPCLTFARSAGTGSLGRPRFVAVAQWQGGPVLRECKTILASAWSVFGDGRDAPIMAGQIAGGSTRAVDPHYRIENGLLVRRLSPNSRKVEVGDAGDLLSSPDMLRLMGREIACCHAADGARLEAVRADVAGRETGWLRDHARTAADAVRRDFAAFA